MGWPPTGIFLQRKQGLPLAFPHAGAVPLLNCTPKGRGTGGQRDVAETEKQKERERTEGREEERRVHVGGRGDCAGLRRKAEGEVSELAKGATLVSYPQFKFLKHLLNNHPSLPSENRHLSLPLWLTA